MQCMVIRSPISGEIEVGDTVKSESLGPVYVKVTGITPDGDFITDEPDWYEPNYYFVLPKSKAVKYGGLEVVTANGTYPISEAAKGIKVGDRVSDTDIQLFWQPGGKGSETWNLTSLNIMSDELRTELLKAGAYIVAKIKCPCCDTWK